MLITPRNLHPNINLNGLETKELLTFHPGCYGNWVTIAMRYVADAYRSKEPQCQVSAQINLKQRSY